MITAALFSLITTFCFGMFCGYQARGLIQAVVAWRAARKAAP